VLDAGSGQVVRTIHLVGLAPATAVAFNPDGALLAGGWSGIVQHFDPRTGHQFGHPVLTEAGPVASLAVSPDGRRFVTTGGATGGMRLWDDATLQEVGSDFGGGNGQKGNAGFTRGGATVVVLYSDGTGDVWPVSDAALLAQTCAVAGRNLTTEEWRRFVPNAPYQRTCPAYP
jgi:WD40 repeat protein